MSSKLPRATWRVLSPSCTGYFKQEINEQSRARENTRCRSGLFADFEKLSDKVWKSCEETQ